MTLLQTHSALRVFGRPFYGCHLLVPKFDDNRTAYPIWSSIGIHAIHPIVCRSLELDIYP